MTGTRWTQDFLSPTVRETGPGKMPPPQLNALVSVLLECIH